MRRRLETILPAVVLIGFLAAALLMTLLLANAEDRGVDALEESIAAEVDAIAGSQNERFVNTLSGAVTLSRGLGGEPFTLAEGSPEDLQALEGLLRLVPDIRSGFYLVDIDDRITQGVQLTEDVVGTTFEWPGYDALEEAQTFAQGVGAILPASDGITTEEPVVALVFPILDDATRARRGAFVFESVIAEDSDFNEEIGSLSRGETGEFLFYDSRGTVIASNDASLIAEPVDDTRLVGGPLGTHRYDDQVVVVAEVPAAGWRVAFRQDADEFEQALARPLESAGRILVLAILVAGALITILLDRRLRAARAEQDRLRMLSEAQQEFISIVSHELRTPVAGVLGFLETSLDHWDAMDDADRRSAVARAAINARRLQAMTRDVLDTQNVEAGRLVHVLQRLDLANEVRVAVDAARELDPDRSLEVDVPAEPVWVAGDADRIQQVLSNLIDNAHKNSPAVEPVAVAMRVDGTEAELTVSDRGAGITEEVMGHIFDKFVRGRGDAVSGTGLGLYIARQIVEAHDGRIWAESTPGEGATFHVTIPLEPRQT